MKIPNELHNGKQILGILKLYRNNELMYEHWYSTRTERKQVVADWEYRIRKIKHLAQYELSIIENPDKVERLDELKKRKSMRKGLRVASDEERIY